MAVFIQCLNKILSRILTLLKEPKCKVTSCSNLRRDSCFQSHSRKASSRRSPLSPYTMLSPPPSANQPGSYPTEISCPPPSLHQKEGLVADLWRTQLSLWTLALGTTITYVTRRPCLRSFAIATLILSCVWMAAMALAASIVAAYVLHLKFLATALRLYSLSWQQSSPHSSCGASSAFVSGDFDDVARLRRRASVTQRSMVCSNGTLGRRLSIEEQKLVYLTVLTTSEEAMARSGGRRLPHEESMYCLEPTRPKSA